MVSEDILPIRVKELIVIALLASKGQYEALVSLTLTLGSISLQVLDVRFLHEKVVFNS